MIRQKISIYASVPVRIHRHFSMCKISLGVVMHISIVYSPMFSKWKDRIKRDFYVNGGVIKDWEHVASEWTSDLLIYIILEQIRHHEYKKFYAKINRTIIKSKNYKVINRIFLVLCSFEFNTWWVEVADCAFLQPCCQLTNYRLSFVVCLVKEIELYQNYCYASSPRLELTLFYENIFGCSELKQTFWLQTIGNCLLLKVETFTLIPDVESYCTAKRKYELFTGSPGVDRGEVIPIWLTFIFMIEICFYEHSHHFSAWGHFSNFSDQPDFAKMAKSAI